MTGEFDRPLSSLIFALSDFDRFVTFDSIFNLGLDLSMLWGELI